MAGGWEWLLLILPLTQAGREEGAVEHDVEARPQITTPGIRLPSTRQALGRRM